MQKLFRLMLGLALLAAPSVMHAQYGQNTTNQQRSGYYQDGYNRGYDAGRADAQAQRTYNERAALVTVGNVSGLSADFRAGFDRGYSEGFSGRNRTTDWRNDRNGNGTYGDNRNGGYGNSADAQNGYDRGFNAGQSDAQARRSYNERRALGSAGNVSALSADFRSGFDRGYRDGYNGNGRNTDWRNNRNGNGQVNCNNNDRDRDGNCITNNNNNGRHDNGKHKGWYKNGKNKQNRDNDNDNDNDNDHGKKHKNKDKEKDERD